MYVFTGEANNSIKCWCTGEFEANGSINVCVCVQVKVSKPTPEQMVILDEQFGEKLKAKEKKEDDTITESTILHGLSTIYLYFLNHGVFSFLLWSVCCFLYNQTLLFVALSLCLSFSLPCLSFSHQLKILATISVAPTSTSDKIWTSTFEPRNRLQSASLPRSWCTRGSATRRGSQPYDCFPTQATGYCLPAWTPRSRFEKKERRKEWAVRVGSFSERSFYLKQLQSYMGKHGTRHYSKDTL